MLNRLLNNRKFVAAVMTFSVVIAIAWVEQFQENQNQNLRSLELEQAKREVSTIRANLESQLYSEVLLTSVISTHILVEQNPSPSQLEEIVTQVLNKTEHIQSIGVAPNDVIQHVFPFEANKSVIGLDYRTIPEQWLSVQKARELESTLISGPVTLFQGGTALIGRTPVFLDPPINSDYWGLLSIVMNLESHLTEAGLYKFNNQFDVAIQGKDGKGENGEFFYGNAEIIKSSFIQEEVILPHGKWVLYAATPPNWVISQPWYVTHNVRLMLYPALLLFIIAFFTIYKLYQSAYKNSLHDDLTGLPNRRYVMYTLESLADKTTRSDGVFSIFNIDLNKFKVINDTYGHAAGDLLLQETAYRLKRSLRNADIVARLGGDEFLVVLPRVSKPGELYNIINHLHYNLTKDPLIFKGDEIAISASIGFAVFDSSMENIDELLIQADQNMYESKRDANYLEEALGFNRKAATNQSEPKAFDLTYH